MPETAEQVYARVVALVGDDGRLPLPDVAASDTFPWEGEIRPPRLLPPVDREQPRNGEGGEACWRCAHPDTGVIWRNERWLVSTTERPTGLPIVLFLQSREHMDFLDMDDDLAEEYGRITNHLHRIVHYLPNIGRVHVCNWGDDSEHLQVWVMGRTARLSQTIGSHAAEWNRLLPPGPEDVWRADLHEVARKLANHGGEALV